MNIKKFKRTIQQFLNDGHAYTELQGKRINQDGEILYISNRLFSPKEVKDFQKYAEMLMQYLKEDKFKDSRFIIRLYGAADADARMVTWIYSQVALVEETFEIPDDLDVTKMFEYQGYSFIPAGTWKNRDIDGNFFECQRRLTSDYSLKMTNYMGADFHWNHQDFYEAAGGYDKCLDDFFFCVEKNSYYCPCPNEIFRLKSSFSGV